MNGLSNFVFIGTFLWLLGGCVIQTDPSEKNAFDGVYRITTHTRNEMDCTSPGTAVADGDAFFKLGEEFVNDVQPPTKAVGTFSGRPVRLRLS
jgi:hypothetical protein